MSDKDDINDATSIAEVRIHPLLIPVQTHNTQANDVSEVDMRMVALREAVSIRPYSADDDNTRRTLEAAKAFFEWMKSGTVPEADA